MSTRRFPLFDSMRGIGAVAVLTYHALFASTVLTFHSPVLRKAISHFDVFPPMFFALSAFLLYRPFVAARLSGRRLPRTGVYGMRRVMRVIPGYWLALTIVAVVLGLHEVEHAAGIARYYLLGQVYDGSTVFRGMVQAWTICVELTFYAMLPLYALALRRIRWGAGLRLEWAGVGVLIALSIAWKLAGWVIFPDVHSLHVLPWFMTLPMFLDWFALGMALAVVAAARDEGVPLRAAPALLRRFPSLPWLVCLLAYVGLLAIGQVTIAGVVDGVGFGTFWLAHALYGIFAVCFVMPAVRVDLSRGIAWRVLSNRVLIFLGVISFGIYLYHVMIYKEVAAVMGRHAFGHQLWIPGYVIGLALSIVAGVVSWYAVERPALRVSSRWPRRRSERQLEAAAAPAAPP